MRTGNEGCREFRAALSRALEGLPVPDELTVLGWHEHLLSCAECRRLLEREEALEELLATMPRPKLPPDLTRRVLLRLRESREETPGLDQLLELAEAAPPAGLSGRVRAGIALERLLELDPEPIVPKGLAARVLEGLEEERWEPVATAPRRLRLLRSPVFYAAAAGLLFAAISLGIWLGRERPVDPGDDDWFVIDDTAEVIEPDPELLANLDLLEPDSLWDDLGEDLPLLLANSVDVVDELLYEYEKGEESW